MIFRLTPKLKTAQKEQPLLGFCDTVTDMCRPGQVNGDVDAQELEGIDDFDLHTINDEWFKCGLLLPGVDNHLFGFRDIELEVVVRAPHHQIVNLVAVVRFTCLNQPSNGCVISKLIDETFII